MGHMEIDIGLGVGIGTYTYNKPKSDAIDELIESAKTLADNYHDRTREQLDTDIDDLLHDLFAKVRAVKKFEKGENK